jgi:hypothetical protein
MSKATGGFMFSGKRSLVLISLNEDILWHCYSLPCAVQVNIEVSGSIVAFTGWSLCVDMNLTLDIIEVIVGMGIGGPLGKRDIR